MLASDDRGGWRMIEFQSSEGLNMRYQWISNEHHRMHIVEAWPDGPYKDATLRAIHSTLYRLAQDPSVAAGLPTS